MEFSKANYETLLPLKEKWEKYKSSQSASISVPDRSLIGKVFRELMGHEADWCCAGVIAENFRQVMIRFDKYEASK